MFSTNKIYIAINFICNTSSISDLLLLICYPFYFLIDLKLSLFFLFKKLKNIYDKRLGLVDPINGYHY